MLQATLTHMHPAMKTAHQQLHTSNTTSMQMKLFHTLPLRASWAMAVHHSSSSSCSSSSSPLLQPLAAAGSSVHKHNSRGVRTAAQRGDQAAADRVHVTIVGGGAAGLTAAFFAAEQGAKVTVLERTREAGKKILMSGGSRCNVLPFETDIQKDFFSESPASAVRAVFASWPLEQCREWLEDPESGVGLDLALEEETNKWFPVSNSSKDVRDRLVAACLRRGVHIRYDSSVEDLQPIHSSSSSSTASAERASSSSGSDKQIDHSSSSSASNGTHAGSSNGDSDSSSSSGLSSPVGWVCKLKDGSQHRTDRLVIATGGLSFPLVGTDGTGHRILRALGHNMKEPYPALTPLVGPHPAGQQLAGLSMYEIDITAHLPDARKPKRTPRTAMLFTHKGYSGPAVLDLSHWAVMQMTRKGSSDGSSAGPSSGSSGGSSASGVQLMVNWTHEPPEVWEARLKAGGKAQIPSILQRHGIRERLAIALCAELGLSDRKAAELKKTERQALLSALTSYPLQVTGHEGYKKAEVTGGGVPLSEVDCATMESRLLPGMHLCGEVLDVFGRIGGFNFYWAWVSGRLAGLGAAKGGKQLGVANKADRKIAAKAA